MVVTLAPAALFPRWWFAVRVGQQLAEPDSPTPPALCYTIADTFGCKPGADQGLVG